MAMGLRFPGRGVWACPVPGRPREALVELPLGGDRVDACKGLSPPARAADLETWVGGGAGGACCTLGMIMRTRRVGFHEALHRQATRLRPGSGACLVRAQTRPAAKLTAPLVGITNRQDDVAERWRLPFLGRMAVMSTVRRRSASRKHASPPGRRFAVFTLTLTIPSSSRRRLPPLAHTRPRPRPAVYQTHRRSPSGTRSRTTSPTCCGIRCSARWAAGSPPARCARCGSPHASSAAAARRRCGRPGTRGA